METPEVHTERREQPVDVALVVSGGEPLPGTWTGVSHGGFDGPGTRRVAVRVVAAG